MRACQDCGSNDWRFKTEGGMTVATCKNCSQQLRWAKKKKTKLNNSEPDACECGGRKFEREKREVTVAVLHEPFYFKYYFICQKCKKDYPDKTTKKYNALY